MLRNGLLLILIGILVPAISYGQANQGGGAKAGLILGYTVPDAENTKPHRLWGLSGTAMVNKNWGINGYYLLADKQVGTSVRKFEHSIHGVGISYHVLGGKGDTFYGIRAGLSKLETVQAGSTNVTFSPSHWGFAAGYDYNIFSFMTIGFEGTYLTFEDSEANVGGTDYLEDKFRSISFAGSLKFKF